jgi:predicted ATPase/class 3 adenylate cyclase
MRESHGADAALSTGVVTLMFTDIEGSTALWEQDGARMSQALAAHDALARSTVESRHGRVVKMLGDGMHAVFDNALDALAATVDLQQALADPAATSGVPLRVRCGLHAGLVERRDNDYFGSPVNRAARIMSAAHGGQVLLSQAVVDSVRNALPAAMSLRDLGKVRLKDLATPEHVYQIVHPQLRQQFPALRSLEATPNNLPQQTTNFIGREQALTELQRLLAKTRLLTLTGSGGCGKTRLCLHVAADSLERFPDGAWLVELAPLSDPERVPQAVATVLGLKEEPGKTISQTLSGHLKDEQLLLIFDNCEHLLEGCARLADMLLRQCPHVTILASTREALAIGGEQTYRVPSLSLPDPRHVHTSASVAPFEAVQLFTDRALLASPDFQVTDHNASAIAAICYRLDGIPLAIELAAARVRSLSVEEINKKLDQRFRLLTGGSRTALPRQQTLRALIDWSYDLLGAAERALLHRVSVFAGGWTLAAAERVCSGNGVAEEEVFNLLAALADKSLVLVEERDGTTRYRLLETVRQYARDRLLESGEGEAWRDRHLAFFMSVAEEARRHLRGADQKAWVDRLDADHDNLRAALAWSSAPGANATGGLRLADALFMFWYVRGYFGEAYRWITGLLAVGQGVPADVRAEALAGAGVMAWQQGDYSAARRLHEECLSIQRSAGDRVAIARSLMNLGAVDFDQGDYAAARAKFEEALAIRRKLGSAQGIAGVLHDLGAVAKASGDLDVARELFEESLATYRGIGDLWGTAISLSNLGSVAYDSADYAAARALQEESLVIRRELGDRRGIAESLEGMAGVMSACTRPGEASRIWGATERLREEIGAPLSPTERADHDLQVSAARVAMADPTSFELAWQEGRAMTLEQAIDYALVKHNA